MAVTFKPEPVEARLPPAKPKPAVDPKEHKKALEAISKHRRAIAWQVGRYPLEKRVAEERTKIHLPRSYLARHGEDVKTVWPGTDINLLVHMHYFELTEAVVNENPNYVTPDSIDTRRHEYLGPDPRIAGYRLDASGEIHIKWWDAFLQDLWMDRTKWSFEVVLTDTGKWVEVDD